MNIQLLCTFTKPFNLTETINTIQKRYDIVSNKLFILENKEDASQLILTYNVRGMSMDDILESTISVHRKKHTNTIYTINALNQLILENNDGVLDKRFKVEWESYRDCILVTAYGKLKEIPTKIREITILES